MEKVVRSRRVRGSSTGSGEREREKGEADVPRLPGSPDSHEIAVKIPPGYPHILDNQRRSGLPKTAGIPHGRDEIPDQIRCAQSPEIQAGGGEMKVAEGMVLPISDPSA
jgi:hypothetical protein